MLTGPTTAPSTETDASPSIERRLLAIAIAVGLLIVAASLLRHDGDITGLVKFGNSDHAAPLTAHVESLLGREVATVDKLGHDGSMFFLQAVDPFFLEPDVHSVHFDRPVYRAQRMLFPLIAGGAGLVPVSLIPWTMALTNIAALALGTLAASRIATRLGGSPWLGLGFLMNPGVIFEFDISGAGIVAFAAALWGTVALMDGRRRSAVLWFTAAVLAREVMFLYLAGVLLYQWASTRRFPFIYGAVPSVAALSWAVYIRLRLEAGSGVDEVQEFGWPFGGMLDAYENWISEPVNLGVILCLVATMPLLVLRTIEPSDPHGWPLGLSRRRGVSRAASRAAGRRRRPADLRAA